MVSFHATKMMTTGEGGIVTSNDRVTVEKMRNIKSNPEICTSSNVDVANHFRERSLFPLTDIQAALGISQLARLDSFVARRKEIADRYFAELGGISGELPFHLRERSVFFRFPIKTEGSVEKSISEFYKQGVCARKPVAVLLHHLRGENGDSFPVAEQHWRETISLPVHPSLTENEIQIVVETALKVLR